MRLHGDLTGLIKFLGRDDWKSSFEEVMGEHFGPAMQAFDLEYEAIGAALGGSWYMSLWGVAFEDFLGRQLEPDGRNFVDEYLKRRGWNESAPTKAYMRGLRNSIMSLYEASAIVPGQSFLARDLLRGGEPVLISERTATRTLKEWDRIAARIVVQGQKRILGNRSCGYIVALAMLIALTAPAGAQLTSQQQRMKDCNTQASGMTGSARKQFMSSCPSGAAAETKNPHCVNGKPCGNSCIVKDEVCHK